MIIQKNNPKINNPILIYSWPSLGLIGRYVINYLVTELKPQVFAEIDLEEYISFNNVIVEKGLIYSAPQLKEKIYFLQSNSYDFIFFYSDFEPSLQNYSKLAIDILNFLNELNISSIITFNSLPTNILHTDTPNLFIASTTSSTKVLPLLQKFDLPKLDFGVVEGMNGIFLSTAKDMGINGICLFCELPFFTLDMYNPQCAKEILSLLAETFGFKLSYEKLYQDINLMDEHLRNIFTDINQKAQQLFSQFYEPNKKQYNKRTKNTTKIDNEYNNGITFDELKKKIKFSLPESAINKINNLFKLAKENIEYAKQLKEELDRWGVYKEYEDKFLSLFLKKKKDG
jgi:predicted ATP-grasp superfamily ATP-dependent carboligase